jgi:mono/diheme cytochrome c family protein
VVHAGSAEDLDAAAARGATVFEKYCTLCHGKTGHGDGRAARLQEARPADLTLSRRSDAYKLQIIRSGGAALQRSASMPAWSDALSEAEMRDVVAYLRTLVKSPVPLSSTVAHESNGAR